MMHLCLNTRHRDGKEEASQYRCGHSACVCVQHGLSPPHLTRWRPTPLVNRRFSREVIFTFVGDWVRRGLVNLVWRRHHLLRVGRWVFFWVWWWYSSRRIRRMGHCCYVPWIKRRWTKQECENEEMLVAHQPTLILSFVPTTLGTKGNRSDIVRRCDVTLWM